MKKKRRKGERKRKYLECEFWFDLGDALGRVREKVNERKEKANERKKGGRRRRRRRRRG
jgi:hypothetical protein